MADEPTSHRQRVIIHGEVDLYEYDDMDRSEVNPDNIAVWERLCTDDVRDSLAGTLDSVDSVSFVPLEDE